MNILKLVFVLVLGASIAGASYADDEYDAGAGDGGMERSAVTSTTPRGEQVGAAVAGAIIGGFAGALASRGRGAGAIAGALIGAGAGAILGDGSSSLAAGRGTANAGNLPNTPQCREYIRYARRAGAPVTGEISAPQKGQSSLRIRGLFEQTTYPKYLISLIFSRFMV